MLFAPRLTSRTVSIRPYTILFSMYFTTSVVLYSATIEGSLPHLIIINLAIKCIIIMRTKDRYIGVTVPTTSLLL